MNLKQKRIAAGRFVLIILSTLTGLVYLGSRKTETHAQNQVPQHARVSAIADWSHRHSVYSTPSSVAQSLKLHRSHATNYSYKEGKRRHRKVTEFVNEKQGRCENSNGIS